VTVADPENLGAEAVEPAIFAHTVFPAVLRYFLRLGTLGFGGPIAVVGYMQRDLVEQRRWPGKQEFLDGVALGQTIPGPLATQVAMRVAYLRRGPLGAVAVAVAFIAPSFLVVSAVATAFVTGRPPRAGRWPGRRRCSPPRPSSASPPARSRP
jgi:chromate transporter